MTVARNADHHLARSVLLLLTSTLLAWGHNETQHPDLPGLLALKASICRNCTELSSWTPEGVMLMCPMQHSRCLTPQPATSLLTKHPHTPDIFVCFRFGLSVTAAKPVDTHTLSDTPPIRCSSRRSTTRSCRPCAEQPTPVRLSRPFYSYTGSVCSSFDGVYCAWVLGSWRVVGVQLQLDVGVVALNDSAMQPGGVLQGIQHLRELEVLRVKQRPPAPGEVALLHHMCTQPQ